MIDSSWVLLRSMKFLWPKSRDDLLNINQEALLSPYSLNGQWKQYNACHSIKKNVFFFQDGQDRVCWVPNLPAHWLSPTAAHTETQPGLEEQSSRWCSGYSRAVAESPSRTVRPSGLNSQSQLPTSWWAGKG